MQIHYTCPYWGQERLTGADFMNRVVEEGYDGIEIDLPGSKEFVAGFMAELDSVRSKRKGWFLFIAQQVLPSAAEPVDDYIARMKNRLRFLISLQPDFINSHTGKDFFSFDDNCRVIEAAMEIAAHSGIPIMHETHRGRFSFHAAGILPYLQKFPEMELVGDISHWCTVSESLLRDQEDILEKIIPHIGHVHARIGHEQGPQVNDPSAPEWQGHVARFIDWWKKIIAYRSKIKKELSISPEFGPAPYMPSLPFTQMPMGDQWKINAGMKDLLKRELFTPDVNTG